MTLKTILCKIKKELRSFSMEGRKDQNDERAASVKTATLLSQVVHTLFYTECPSPFFVFTGMPNRQRRKCPGASRQRFKLG